MVKSTFAAIAFIGSCALVPGAYASSGQVSREPVQQPKWVKVATTCFGTGEQTSGMNKICFYNCLGSQAAITISVTSLCPLSIER